MGYDLFPLDTLTFKRAFLREAVEREYLIIFEHDPNIAAGYIREGRKRYIEKLRDGLRLPARKPEARSCRGGCILTVQIGVIGGSGLYDMAELTDREERTLKTPFGDPSGPYLLGTLRGKRVAFLARHGAGHRLLPSELNFRANIFGFKLLGVERIISASAVGSLKAEYPPLDIVVPDQFFDRTTSRISTFFGGGLAAHVSFAHPDLSGARSRRRRRRAVGRRERPPRRARTSAWRGRSFRRLPSRSSIDRGAWTSSG